MIQMNKIKQKRYHDKMPYEIIYFSSDFNLALYLVIHHATLNYQKIIKLDFIDDPDK